MNTTVAGVDLDKLSVNDLTVLMRRAQELKRSKATPHTAD